jgi:tRNA threonylcarbamoyladenosine biosynthesis protein TsaB
MGDVAATVQILALETSTNRGSIALLRDACVVVQRALPDDQATAQSLAPAMKELLQQADWQPHEVGLVAVTNGPGSFTGLRIGVTTAKTFAYATQASVVATNTLDVLVSQLPESVDTACALMGAQRGQYFAAIYRRGPGHQWQATRDCQIVDWEQLLGLLPAKAVLTGPGTTALPAPLPATLQLADQPYLQPTAAAVGRLAWRAFCAGRRDDLWSLSPRYYRRSYAEETRPT